MLEVGVDFSKLKKEKKETLFLFKLGVLPWRAQREVGVIIGPVSICQIISISDYSVSLTKKLTNLKNVQLCLWCLAHNTVWLVKRHSLKIQSHLNLHSNLLLNISHICSWQEGSYAKAENFTWDLTTMNRPNLSIKKVFILHNWLQALVNTIYDQIWSFMTFWKAIQTCCLLLDAKKNIQILAEGKCGTHVRWK